ncbi:MAG: alpha/beta fold hydrolase [Kordiimonas sp.]
MRLTLYYFSLMFLSCNALADKAAEYGSNASIGKYLQLPDISLYYETYGDGAPILIIHGNAGSIKDMAPQISHFSKNRRVIVADSRGHGKSGLGKDPLTYEKITADLIKLLDHLGIEKTDIIGWSDGGIVGLHMAMSHPGRLEKLVTFGANLFAGEPAIYPWLNGPLEAWKSAIEAGLASDPSSPEWTIQDQHYKLLMNMTPISKDMLRKITTPTLVIAADRDAITNHHTVEIFEALTNAHLAVLPGSTHWAPMQQPALFNQLTENFLEEPYKRPSSRDAF